MKILIPDWKIFGKEDIASVLHKMGHEVLFYKKEPREYRYDPEFRSELRSFMKKQQIDLVFSVNYYPVLSTTCMDSKLLYISWCYDSPLILTYSDTIFNSCNYVFIFDSQMVADLKSIGVKNVYYMPLAVNTKRLRQLNLSHEQTMILNADVAFVGSLYNEKHNLYERMKNLQPETRGYLEGIMQAQSLVYGYNFLEDVLPGQIIEDMQKSMPLEVHRDGKETLAYVYANYFLCREITRWERDEILKILDQNDEIITKLYTINSTPQLKHIKNMGTVQYQNEMPLVFRCSKINLNITLRSIKSGIPLRAMDIMGAGGFLLTNYQSDFLKHFVEGEDYVAFESTSDMMDKIYYYLRNDAERCEIAQNGYRKICKNHDYYDTVGKMFEIAKI